MVPWLLSFLGFIQARQFLPVGTSGVASAFCSDILHSWGYPCLDYKVTTEDGFILGVQRIPYGQNGKKSVSGSPVFLQHGLFQGGDAWFQNSPKQSLGFILADAGFDVWVGNVRGTRWTHGHVSVSRDKKEFWDWSWDELAEYDLFAMLELVCNVTKSQVYYVGHSQGTIMAFAAFTQPRVMKMIAAAALLSPIAFLGNITSQFALAAAHMHLDQVINDMGVQEINLRSDFAVDIADLVCSSSKLNCGDLIASITGPSCCFNNSRIPIYLKFEPHPSSTKNMKHLFQMIRKGTFEKFDYGLAGNLKHYSRTSAPAYDLSTIPKDLPLWMSYGGMDALSDPKDVSVMRKKLLCSVELLYLENYGHLDFILSVNAKADLYDKLVNFLLMQEDHSNI